MYLPMIKKNIVLLFILLSLKAFTQQEIAKNRFITADISNFWNAYDSVHSTTDSLKQINFLQKLYFDKATSGLQYFSSQNDLTPQYMQSVIEKYPKFWESIRTNTNSINEFEIAFKKVSKKFQKIYPSLKNGDFYFLIGGLKNGGSVYNNNVLIGAELAVSNKFTDATELKQSYQERMILNKNLLFIITHEYVHIQQNRSLSDSTINVLTYSLKEGSADFIASLLINEEVPTPYITYGINHEKEVWKIFKQEMYTQELKKWIRNIEHPSFNVKELGYFMGYSICKSYYNNAIDKQKAIKEIMELDYSNQKQLNEFLKNSKYQEKWEN